MYLAAVRLRLRGLAAAGLRPLVLRAAGLEVVRLVGRLAALLLGLVRELPPLPDPERLVPLLFCVRERDEPARLVDEVPRLDLELPREDPPRPEDALPAEEDFRLDEPSSVRDRLRGRGLGFPLPPAPRPPVFLLLPMDSRHTSQYASMPRTQRPCLAGPVRRRGNRFFMLV